jgi:hypothetical protein
MTIVPEAGAAANSRTPPPQAYAGAGGIGGGTLLVVIATLLPEGYWLTPILYWAAPAASVTLTGVWVWILRRVKERVRQREQTARVEDARAAVTRALENRHTSPEHREKLRLQLEELQLLEVEASMERFRVSLSREES